MLAAGEVQRDPASCLCRHDAGSEHTGTIVGWLARQTQHAHRGVVVVQHFALRRLPDQLVTRGFDHLRGFFHDLPLRRGGQRNAQQLLQLFQSIKRHSTAVLQQRDHRRGGLVVFFGADAFRFRRGKYFAAQVAAQPIQLVHGCCQRRLAHDSHQRLGFFLRIDFAFFAARAGIAGVQAWDAAPQLSSRRCTRKPRCARGPAFYQKGAPNPFQARAFPAVPKRSWSFRWCVGQAAFPPAHAIRVSASRLRIRSTARACRDQ